MGRVKRTPIKPAESDTDKDFKTLDKVEIYLRELYPLGTMLPLSRVAWVLTTWDAKDGIPIRSFEIPKNTKSKYLFPSNHYFLSFIFPPLPHHPLLIFRFRIDAKANTGSAKLHIVLRTYFRVYTHLIIILIPLCFIHLVPLFISHSI